jgi:4-hydroxy-tetrahydrodipicolinate synthase
MHGTKQLAGVIAAMLMPRDDGGRLEWEAFDRNARFVMRVGISGLCVNGATGEYAGSTAGERQEAVRRARSLAGESRLVLSGIGAARWSHVLDLAREAENAGADALLLPAPHFFGYAPGDLAEFYRRTVPELRVPVLIYNLPAFTGGLDSELASSLIREVDGIAGVKDSSGELELLEALTMADGFKTIRFVGNDGVLVEALARGLCDGTISGVAGVVPELILALWNSADHRAEGLFDDLGTRLDELLHRLDEFPTPWGLKLIAELRGFSPASFALPLSAKRRIQARAFQAWFSDWWKAGEASFARALAAEVSISLA